MGGVSCVAGALVQNAAASAAATVRARRRRRRVTRVVRRLPCQPSGCLLGVCSCPAVGPLPWVSEHEADPAHRRRTQLPPGEAHRLLGGLLPCAAAAAAGACAESNKAALHTLPLPLLLPLLPIRRWRGCRCLALPSPPSPACAWCWSGWARRMAGARCCGTTSARSRSCEQAGWIRGWVAAGLLRLWSVQGGGCWAACAPCPVRSRHLPGQLHPAAGSKLCVCLARPSQLHQRQAVCGA